MSAPHSSLSAAADERKSRLARLKSLKRKQPSDEAPARASFESSPKAPSPPAAARDDDVARIHLSGRNYDVETKGPKLGFEAPPIPDQPTLEEKAAEVEAEVRLRAAQDAQDDAGIDLFKLQPKKPNWDLKRDLDQKLEILNARTDNAIAKLIRQRIANAEKGQGKALASGDETVGMDGNTLVEGLRQREQEEQDEERREREMDMEA